MHEREYLDQPVVAEFVDFVKRLVADGVPRVKWRVGPAGARQDVSSLREALAAYSWRGECFRTVDIKVEALRREMQSALARCAAAQDDVSRRLAELEVLFVSNKALSWGRVYEGAFGFLIHQAETGVLSQNLSRAAALLDGTVEDVNAFDDHPLRSDCGMTKVYAAMTRRSVVYDVRVSAGLGLLCRRHLEIRGRRRLPEPLAFMAGDRDDPRHDPSTDAFVFPDKQAGREHARWNLRTNWIVSRVAADPTVSAAFGGHLRRRIRQIEAALFTIGDDVRDQPRAASAPARMPLRVALPVPLPEGDTTSS